jgi:hypothetical protein
LTVPFRVQLQLLYRAVNLLTDAIDDSQSSRDVYYHCQWDHSYHSHRLHWLLLLLVQWLHFRVALHDQSVYPLPTHSPHLYL